MSVWGKLLAGTFGFALGGPIGALLGVIAGHSVDKIRKQIVAKQYIKKGTIFSETNLTTKRAKKGIPASHWNKVLGRKSNFNFKIDENIKL